MVRKGSKSLTADPLSMLATFYAPGKTRRELRTIVDNVSLEIEDGYRLALIGRNGAGKTTLLRLLAGSFTPTRGMIVTRGQVQALLNSRSASRASPPASRISICAACRWA